MIDFISFEVPSSVGAKWLKNDLLSFGRTMNEDTRELFVQEARTASHRQMIFAIYPSGRCTVKGSLHKFYHDGINSGDFSRKQFCEAAMDFCATFEMNPNELKILQLEYGFNIQVPHTFDTSLSQFVCLSNGIPFIPMATSRPKSIGITANRDEYNVKIYNKIISVEHATLNTIRFELKITSSRFLNKLGIYTLADLFNPVRFRELTNVLCLRIHGAIIKEPVIDITQLSRVKLVWFYEAMTANYWAKLSPKNRHLQRIRWKELVERFGGPKFKESFLKLIREKEESLMKDEGFFTSENWDVFSTFSMEDILQKLGCFKGLGNDGIHSSSQIEKDSSPRRCRTCGRDISNQRQNSVYCSEKIYGKEVKRCRNKQSNPVNNYLRSIDNLSKGGTLFDWRPHIRSLPEGVCDESRAVFNEQLRQRWDNLNKVTPAAPKGL
jgi:hypothetical protein